MKITSAGYQLLSLVFLALASGSKAQVLMKGTGELAGLLGDIWTAGLASEELSLFHG